MNLKNLIIVAMSLSLIGCIGGGGGGTSSSVVASSSSADYALAKSTLFTEGDSASQNTIKSRSTWTAIEAAGATHPYEQMGLHKVQSFSKDGAYLTGVGETIHIADFYCDVNHDIYDNKTITNLDDGGSGESTFDSATSSNNHCQGVAMFAAGDVSARSGVAPDADLVLSSIRKYEGSNEGDDYASDLDAARAAGAVASNQSWGYTSGGTSYNISELESLISSNSLTNAQGLATLMHGSSSGQDLTDSNTYITALDNFESSGVVVWSAGNDVGESDASAMAGLPELFPDLGEAWIVANVVEYTGDSDLSNAISSEFTLKGNKCGSTAEYCLSVDGYDVNAATYVDSGTSQYDSDAGTISYGSSWTAPMVSGGVALMAQAFPNHTAEQLVDRILASANNVWFTPEGNTTFTTHGNSVKHGYHSTWGHGVPDFYAALSPITSDGNPASMSLYTSNSIQSSAANKLGSSYISSSASFGDAVSHGLIGEVGYAYDDLNGGFNFDMSTRVGTSNNHEITINLSEELSRLDTPMNDHDDYSSEKKFIGNASTLFHSNKLETSLTFGNNTLPVQSFFGKGSEPTLDLSDFETPYLASNSDGLGLNASYKLENSQLLIGASNPIRSPYDESSTIGIRQSIVASLEYGNTDDANFTVMTGITLEKDHLLGLKGSDAFSTVGANSSTVFSALKAQSHINEGLSLTGLAMIANTNMTKPDSSFIDSASNVKSSSLALVASQKNILGDDQFSLSISQPNRVNGGEMSIRMANLAESDGTISYRNKGIDLKAGGREIAYGLSYRKDFDDQFGFSIKHVLTSNQNHIEDAKIARSSYVGLNYKDLKLGYNVDSTNALKQAKISYQYSF